MVLIFKTILLVLVALLFVLLCVLQKESKIIKDYGDLLDIIILRCWQLLLVSEIVLILLIVIFVK